MTPGISATASAVAAAVPKCTLVAWRTALPRSRSLPHLGVDRAPLSDQIKAPTGVLAMANHPDAAGEAALPSLPAFRRPMSNRRNVECSRVAPAASVDSIEPTDSTTVRTVALGTDLGPDRPVGTALCRRAPGRRPSGGRGGLGREVRALGAAAQRAPRPAWERHGEKGATVPRGAAAAQGHPRLPTSYDDPTHSVRALLWRRHCTA